MKEIQKKHIDMYVQLEELFSKHHISIRNEDDSIKEFPELLKIVKTHFTEEQTKQFTDILTESVVREVINE